MGRHAREDAETELAAIGGQTTGDDEALTVDPATRELAYLGARVRLTPAQTSVMLLLVRAGPQSVSPQQISKAVRGYVPARETPAVRVLIHGLRRACRETFDDEFIETVLGRGTGYGRELWLAR